MESLKRKRHDEIVNRWFAVRTPGSADYGKRDYDTSHIASLDIGYANWRQSAGEHDAGDELRSYGAHFPLVQCIRGNRRRAHNTPATPRLWLLNGDTWGGASGFGMSTSGQQAQARRLAEDSGLPSIILPFSAIDAAGIEHGSIHVLAQDDDKWFTEPYVTSEFPSDAEWKPRHELIALTGWGTHETEFPIRGGYSQSNYGAVAFPTWESIPADIREFFNSDGTVKSGMGIHRPQRQAFGRRYSDWNYAPMRDYASGPIELPADNKGRGFGGVRDYFYVPPIYRYTGRALHGRHGEYEVRADGTYFQMRRVHQLGQSVFRAAYRGSNGKRYWANFLSGVDNTPTGSGYFLVQLPKGADVSSVSAAIESLKPPTVKAAESMGIEVKRQGDIFAIPTEYDMRTLRRMGADIRQSRLASESARARVAQGWEDRFALALQELDMPAERWAYRQSDDNYQWRNYRRLHGHYSTMARAALLEFDTTHRIHTQREAYGTRHVGTDIAILPSGVTLARGTLRHSGGDHSMLRMGKTWHILVRNTVPLAR